MTLPQGDQPRISAPARRSARSSWLPLDARCGLERERAGLGSTVAVRRWRSRRARGNAVPGEVVAVDVLVSQSLERAVPGLVVWAT